ncbi:SDR family oxidoreductase [Angustibacter luteus]|uniref:SDR family oxidoreductase n=1 Tax=Angustibacter luteus TaxID=658456 RepID=A0ABW1JKF2_9ACTN
MTEPVFDLQDAGVVVTGGGSGIGAELCRRFATRGARVVVNDLNPDAAQAVASEIGALAAPGDAATAEGVAALVALAREHLGEVDLFCANAGVAPRGGPVGPGATTPQAWSQALEVNVLAHVRAAEELLPAWLERGRGHLLVTASAAGLLTMLGSAPYAVTKHAAVAFAEWMRLTYSHRGIVVQALCPQGVRTPMLEGSGRLGRALLEPDAVDVSVVGDAVLAALRTGEFLVLPHPEVAGYLAAKAADPDGWVDSMNRLQQRLESGR